VCPPPLPQIAIYSMHLLSLSHQSVMQGHILIIRSKGLNVDNLIWLWRRLRWQRGLTRENSKTLLVISALRRPLPRSLHTSYRNNVTRSLSGSEVSISGPYLRGRYKRRTWLNITAIDTSSSVRNKNLAYDNKLGRVYTQRKKA
jgi:hypothetical protein